MSDRDEQCEAMQMCAPLLALLVLTLGYARPVAAQLLGETAATAAASCEAIAQARPCAASGTYFVRIANAGAERRRCELDGGWTQVWPVRAPADDDDDCENESAGDWRRADSSAGVTLCETEDDGDGGCQGFVVTAPSFALLRAELAVFSRGHNDAFGAILISFLVFRRMFINNTQTHICRCRQPKEL